MTEGSATGGRPGNQEARRVSQAIVRQSAYSCGAEEERFADVFVGEEAIGSLVLDEDEEDDERSYNFEVKITLGDATTTAPDLKKLDAYLKRKFDNERIRVVPRLKKKDSAEVYVGEEYIGVLFFDEKDARSSYFELPILALDLDEPGICSSG